jgi:uncharacterized membrane protein
MTQEDIMEPQSLQAGRGWQWIKQGYALFIKSPLLWIALIVICLVAAALISAIPVAGDILSALLMPVIVAGLMAGCRAVEKDDELELAHLFSGFKQRTSQLVTLGAISLVAQLLILGAMMAVGGATLVNILISGQQPQDPQVFVQAMMGAGFAILLGLALFIVWIMAMQFAPLLVFFNDVAPVDALKLSLRAFLANIGPMLVYGVTLILLAVLASIPMLLGWLVLFPIIFTSLYASYCDIFPPVVEAAASTTAEAGTKN